MTSLLKLHEEKRHFLKKFNQINSQEILRFSQGDFDGLDYFYDSREKILHILQSLDQKILHESERTRSLTAEQKSALETSLNEIRYLTQSIVQQDMDILTLIEATKTTIIQELRSIQKNKKSVSSYKTKVDHRQIDEEA